jgi:predicted transposase YdaD
MEQRLSSRRARKQAPMVWSAAFILLGLRYSPELSAQLFRGVVSMKESSTYQAILQEGRAEGRGEGAIAEAKRLLHRLGKKALGSPSARTITAIEQIEDLARLEELCERLASVSTWEELLSLRRPGPRKGRR